ncbi:MAG: hypothetical protein WC214_08380 [Candidatus Omnitrophota bacterium]
MKFDHILTTWRYRSTLFAVDVVHWQEAHSTAHRWNVYVYIYPDHPMFDKIEKEHTRLVSLPLHGGASYHEWFYDSTGAVIYKKIGSDYQHAYDSRFAGYSTEDEAWEVFRDAEELIQFMESEG